MFNFEVQGLEEAIKGLDALEKEQLPFALALTATWTAQDVQVAEKKLISNVFDNPTRYTKNSVYIKPATKNNPVAAVWLKDDWSVGFGKGNAAEYLSPHIFGGPRKNKRFEKAMQRRGLLRAGQFTVPAKPAKRDRFGNVSRGQIGKMLSNIGAQHDQHQNSTNSRRSKKKRKNSSYFLFENNDGSLSGVWQRTSKGITPFLLFVDQAPKYKRRFRFFEMAERTMNKRMNINFHRAMDHAIATSIK